jgi:hypothetical protein
VLEIHGGQLRLLFKRADVCVPMSLGIDQCPGGTKGVTEQFWCSDRCLSNIAKTKIPKDDC